MIHYLFYRTWRGFTMNVLMKFGVIQRKISICLNAVREWVRYLWRARVIGIRGQNDKIGDFMSWQRDAIVVAWSDRRYTYGKGYLVKRACTRACRWPHTERRTIACGRSLWETSPLGTDQRMASQTARARFARNISATFVCFCFFLFASLWGSRQLRWQQLRCIGDS